MGCSTSRIRSYSFNRSLSEETAGLLQISDEKVCTQLSTIFEPEVSSTSVGKLSIANLDVVLLGPFATKVAETSAKMTSQFRRKDSRQREGDDSQMMIEGFQRDTDLVGMPQSAPNSVKIRGASRGRECEWKRLEEEIMRESIGEVSTCSTSFSSQSAKSCPSVPRRSLSENSLNGPGRITAVLGQKFKCCVQIGGVLVTVKLWPVECFSDQLPTFSIEKCANIAYLGLVPIDDADPETAWSELAQRLDEIRYFTKVYTGTQTKLGCVPLLTNDKPERRCASDGARPERLNHFATQCAEMGLLDLTHGGGPIRLADTTFLFEVIVRRVAKWCLDQ